MFGGLQFETLKEAKDGILVDLFMVIHTVVYCAFFHILSAEKLVAGNRLHAMKKLCQLDRTTRYIQFHPDFGIASPGFVHSERSRFSKVYRQLKGL